MGFGMGHGLHRARTARDDDAAHPPRPVEPQGVRQAVGSVAEVHPVVRRLAHVADAGEQHGRVGAARQRAQGHGRTLPGQQQLIHQEGIGADKQQPHSRQQPAAATLRASQQRRQQQ